MVESVSEALGELYVSRSGAPLIPDFCGNRYAHKDEIFDHVMKRLTQGESLTAICREPTCPDIGTIFRWMADDEEKREAYRYAREVQASVYASRIVDVAFETADPAIAKVRVDALKWSASRGNPRLYGDSTQLRHADADGNKIDNGPLVSELLGLLGTQPGSSPPQPAARVIADRPAPASEAPRAPVYRPRAAPRRDVDDLV